MATKNYSSSDRLLSYSIIEAAMSGDVDAVNEVLRHYQLYITKLATRTLYDENGAAHLCVDEELQRRMQTKLIMRILTFKLEKTA